MSYYDSYVSFAFFVKIVFIILALIHIFLRLTGKENSFLDIKIKYWKERVEFLFTIIMSLLIIYLFTPKKNRIEKIDKETNLLLYLFGFVLFITAKWEAFFHEPEWIYFLQKTIGQAGTR